MTEKIKCKKRTVVKLDDDLLELTDGPKGKPTAQKLTEDDLLDITVLGDGLEEVLDNKVNQLTNEAYHELTQEFKNNIKLTVMKAMGFDNSWGKWEIDHCNGRMSMLTEFLGSHVRNLVQQELATFTATDMTALFEPCKKVVTKDIIKEFEYHMRQEMRGAAQAAAKAFVKETLAAELEKRKSAMVRKVNGALMANVPESPEED